MSGAKLRRGSTTVTWVPGCSASRWTSSWAACTSLPVRGVDHLERHVLAEPDPPLAQPLRPGAVDDEVHRAQRRRAQAARVAQRGQRGQVHAVHQHQHHPAGVVRLARGDAGRPAVADVLQHLVLGAVLAVQPDEREHPDREDDDDQPRTLGELDDGEDQHDQRGVDPAGRG